MVHRLALLVCSSVIVASLTILPKSSLAETTSPIDSATPQAVATAVGPSAAPTAVATESAAPGTTPPPTQAPSPTPTPATGRRLAAFRVDADRIAFYSNRYILGAEGHVVVTLGDGTRISGNAFYEDLRLNRFVVAGNVHVRAHGTVTAGAAFSEFFDFDRAYFVPITTEPDHWTFAAGDYAHPLLGRELPGDCFFLPNLAGERVFLYSKHAVVDPVQSVRFSPARINFGLAFVLFPTYFLNFSHDPNFAQNALTGAYADGPLDFAGGEHGLATAHIRYDPSNHIYPAYEQHIVSDNSYVVVSANPLTRPLKQYNLLAYDRLSPGLQAQLSLQEIAFQHDFSQPLAASGYANLSITGSLPHSYLQFSSITTYNSLLAPPIGCHSVNGGPHCFYGDPSHGFYPNHPNATTLSWIGTRHQVHDLPLFFQLRSQYGAVTDSIQHETNLGGVETNVNYYRDLGINVTTNAIDLIKDQKGRRRDLYLTASYDKQRTFFSVGPHSTDIAVGSLALSRAIDPQLELLASYSNTQIEDNYGRFQRVVYPGVPAYYSNDLFPTSFLIEGGFFGYGTTRSYNEQVLFTPSHTITLTGDLRENVDFPATTPGRIQLIGGGIDAFFNSGPTPFEASLDLRYRLSPVLAIDIARSYFFNFGGYERWSPQFSIQLEK